jgi:hypothetical protein
VRTGKLLYDQRALSLDSPFLAPGLSFQLYFSLLLFLYQPKTLDIRVSYDGYIPCPFLDVILLTSIPSYYIPFILKHPIKTELPLSSLPSYSGFLSPLQPTTTL